MNQKNDTVVLMYHGVVSKSDDVPPGREPGSELYDVALEKFREHIGYLKSRMFPIISAEDYGMESGIPKVILTFDDGELNNFYNVFPILNRTHTPAYFFMTTQRIGKKGYMGWEELKELRDAELFIGSHGVSHRILTQLKDKEIQDELIGSKQVLEQHLKINVDYFSVPRGFYDERVLRFAKEAGYKFIFVSEAKGSLPQGCFARTAVLGDWPLSRFEMALSGQSPVNERAGAAAKGFLKLILGAVGYDKLRTAVLKKRR